MNMQLEAVLDTNVLISALRCETGRRLNFSDDLAKRCLLATRLIDHEKLTVRTNGVDRRLTDVHGLVISKVLA